MDDPQRRRSGGRAARQALRLARPRRARPVPDPDARAVRGPRRGGPRAHRAQRRHDPRGGRHRVPRRPRGAPAAPRRRRRRRRRARPLPARDVPPDRPGDRAAPVHPVRPQPGAQRRDRRDAHGLRPELRLAVRARPRQRPALRHDRGLPQLREARLHVARTSTTRGGTVCEPVDVPVNKRHLDMVYSHIRYSDKPFMGSVTAPERARDTVEMARIDVRRRLPRGPHGDPDADQRQLAAGLGRDDARRRAGLRRGQPGDAHHAVHPRRRDGAGDRGRRLRPDARRGARPG